MIHLLLKPLLRLTLCLLSAVLFLLRPILTRYGDIFTPRKRIPPVSDPLLEIPAVDLAEKIRNGEVSAESVIRAYVRRIQQVNPLINAVVEDRFEEALQDALRVDQEVQEARLNGRTEDLAVQKPLLGVPLTVKESCSLKGLRLTLGSSSFAHSRAAVSGRAVQLLVDAGAIPLLVSNTPEYCLSWDTFNLVSGRTLNPFDQRRSAGGSSGGEGALLGAGASLIGLGSDLAGSIRIPASFNGVFGHKPSAGAIPVEGLVPTVEDEEILQMISVGPMTRYAKDLPLLFDLLSEGLLKVPRVQLSGVRLFYKARMGTGLHTGAVDEALERRLKEVVDHFYAQGNEVRELGLDLSESLEVVLVHFVRGSPSFSVLDDPSGRRRSRLAEGLKCLFGVANVTFNALFVQTLIDLRVIVPRAIVHHYYAKGVALRKSLTERLLEDGVLLYPTFGCPAPIHYGYHGQMMHVLYTALFNALGLPATQVPVGFSAEGLPIGLQVVAAPGQDHLCFMVAQEIEERFGGWRAPSE